MFTIKAEPLKLNNIAWFNLDIISVQIAVKVSRREFTIDSNRIILPESECWFLVKFEFEYEKNGAKLIRTDGHTDEDSIVTNGSEYFLVNTSLVSPKRKKTRFVLNDQTKNTLDLAIINFVNSL